MDVHYGFEWNLKLRTIRNPYDEATARRRHESGEVYIAALGDPGAPDRVVTVRMGITYVGVEFFNEKPRPYMLYQFQNPEDGRLFLTQTWRALFDDDGNQIGAEIYRFDKDGLVHVEEHDLVDKTVDTYKVKADVSGNWEPIPDFGDYESIARVERDRPPLEGN